MSCWATFLWCFCRINRGQAGGKFSTLPKTIISQWMTSFLISEKGFEFWFLLFSVSATATVQRKLLSPSAVAVFWSRCYQRLAMFCWFCFGLSLLLDALTRKKYLFTFQNQKFRKNLLVHFMCLFRRFRTFRINHGNHNNRIDWFFRCQ